MVIELVHIGFGNILAMNRVIAIASPNSAPTKRTIHEGKDNGLLIDMTSGRRTKAVIFTDSGHIVLAALAPETITGTGFPITKANSFSPRFRNASKCRSRMRRTILSFPMTIARWYEALMPYSLSCAITMPDAMYFPPSKG